ncbi:hypothetical protein FRC04_008986 [Tulasnella sp. 424]|nr:hypothetical protein FRC04_008986 [Tulasnella sp. 424]KAG8973643.1 hypothetical protein FRC05_008579 [Tulasnella sp. 425]
MPQLEDPKRVLVVGAGAAGMSCANQLAQHPDRFKVTLVEATDYCGGQAFSIPVDKERHGAEWINQGVQGGSHIFHHTIHMFQKQGHDVTPVNLQVSFGKEDKFWTNVFPTPLLDKHRTEIRRFEKMLKFLRYTEIIFGLLPIKVFLKLWFFSDEFLNFLIYPTVALFLGTGNYTPDVPSIILERLFTSPTYGMWYPADPLSLASNQPPMIVFPELSQFYSGWQRSLQSKGVDIRLSTEVTRIIARSSKGVTVGLRARVRNQDHHNPQSQDITERAAFQSQETIEEFDDVVLCVLPDTSTRLLGKHATWLERKVLGAAKFSDDVTVTHWDSEYMENWYENHFKEDLAVRSLGGGARNEAERVQVGRETFRPMYYIKQTPANPRLLEMAFDCTNYQSQFKKDIPFERHVFQTIFLNKRDHQTWSKSGINPDKIIREDWWHQLCHSYTHYLFVVPFLWLVNSTPLFNLIRRQSRIKFAGSWTLVNAHEVAVMSGIAAAYSLGASYPEELEKDGFALLCFRLYTLLVWGRWYSNGSNRS